MSDARLAAPITLGPGREFDVIRGLIAMWGPLAPGLGDDAALIDLPAHGGQLVVSVDSSVEDVHFRSGWISPREIGWRATAAALSDLAAMAAQPVGVLASITIPPARAAELGEVGHGIGDAVHAANTRIVGGDLTAGPGLSLAITVLGQCARPLRRDAARVGDAVYVTGALGAPGEAVRAWRHGEEPAVAFRARFAHPEPRLAAARWLAEHGAHAAIDISDGLLADAAHVAAASGVRIAIDLDALPTIGGLSPMDAAQSGEEYELLVTAPPPLGEAPGPGIDRSAFVRDTGISLTRIGSVERGAGVEATFRGERVAPGGGFDHFS